MTNLVQSLFRIDPTEGLVQYVNAIKPYHTKVLDVLVEYIYSERAAVTMKDRWSWVMSFTRPDVDIELSCGYGVIWDPIKRSSADNQASIISAQSAVSIPLNVRLTNDPRIVSISQSGISLVTGTRVTLVTTGQLPATIPQVRPGHIYTVTGHNGEFTLTDVASGNVVQFLTNGTGELAISLVDLKFNSFLVAPNYGPEYTIALTNNKSNQFTFVDTHNISAVDPSSKTWTIPTDIRPQYSVLKLVYDRSTLPNVNIAGNCCFVVDGNHEDYFPPGSSIDVSGTTQNNKTFTVADNTSGRQLTRFTGKYTIVPVNEAIKVDAQLGTVRAQLSVYVPVGTHVTVANNTGIGGNGTYTVTGVSRTTNTTTITVDETISTLSANNGNIHVPVGPSHMPQWPTGLMVGFSCTGTFPSPLSSSTRVHFTPTSNPGVFNLSLKRYPSEMSDYVDITSTHTGILKIRRAEMFWPGAYVKVSGSHLNRNDGSYIVRQTVPEGDNVRLYVMEKLVHSTPAGKSFDGTMDFSFDGYDSPSYCPVSKAPDLYTDTFIHETISFEFTINLNDEATTTLRDYRPTGWGASPYGTEGDVDRSNTAVMGKVPESSGTILTTGMDMQLFGLGGLVETIDSVEKNYGRALSP